MGYISVETNLPIAMRDGARLFADVYRPPAPGRYPVLLQRTAYDRSAWRAQFIDAIHEPVADSRDPRTTRPSMFPDREHPSHVLIPINLAK
jgi:predicted acyl esterase